MEIDVLGFSDCGDGKPIECGDSQLGNRGPAHEPAHVFLFQPICNGFSTRATTSPRSSVEYRSSGTGRNTGIWQRRMRDIRVRNESGTANRREEDGNGSAPVLEASDVFRRCRAGPVASGGAVTSPPSSNIKCFRVPQGRWETY
jgi:hypothetical protein